MAESLLTIEEVVRHWANEKPDVEVFTFLNKDGRCGVYTAREIARLGSRFAFLLRNTYGFSQGDVIANGLLNSPERLITDMGIMMAGCIMVNCQVLERDGSDMWNTVRIAECKGVILPVSSGNAPYSIFQPLLVPNASQPSGHLQELADVSTSNAPELRKVILVNRSPVGGANPIQDSFFDRLNAMPEPSQLPATNCEDIVVLFATSGSSGFCKLVPRTHREILDAARSFQGAKDARYFSDRPFGWMGGFPFDYLAYCSVRVLQDQFNGDKVTACRDVWSLIAREKCTAAAMVPVMIEELIHEFQDKKPEFMLPAIVTSGQPLRENLKNALGLITHALVAAYSSTESGMVCASLVASPSQMVDFFSGRPTGPVKIKIVDEDGKEVATGVNGQVLIKSPRNLKSYYKQPEETKSLFTPDGWVQSGDRGWLDEEGNFYCLGRTGDAVLQDSVVIYSSWPEGILAKCPDVVQVSVAVVPISSGENVLCACVVLRPYSDLTEEGLMKFYKESFFGSSACGTEPAAMAKQPRGFLIKLKKILFLDDLPKTQTGKINKKELVSIATKALIG